MKVIFVGNKDITGSAFALKLYKEGHNVYWITDSLEETLFLKGCKGKIYRENVENNRIKSVFKAVSPDIVVFLGNSYVNNDNQDKMNSYILPKLSNVLSILEECNINKFIFLSNLAINSNDNEEKYFYLLCAERLCEYFKNKTNTITSIIRLPFVYHIDTVFEIDTQNQIINIDKAVESIYLPFSKETNYYVIRDSDLAEALYRVLLDMSKSVYLLATHEEVSMVQLAKIIQDVNPNIKGTIFNSDYMKITESNDLYYVQESLGWIPFYSIKNDTDVKNKHVEIKEVINENKVKRNYHISKSILNTCNTLLSFGLVVILSHLIREYSDFRFIDLKLIYVVLVAGFSGKAQSALAMLLACLHQAYSIHQSGIDLSYLVYSIESWTPFAMYILGGSSIGYLFDKRKDEYESLKSEFTSLNNKYLFLKNVYADVCAVKNQLQRQIVVSKDSFGRVYNITKELDTLQPELIFFKTIGIIEDVIDENEVSIYTINDNYFRFARLIANSDSLSGQLQATFQFEDYPLIKECLMNKKMFVNQQLNPNYPSFVVPIFDNDQIIAMVMLNNVSFNKYSLYYQNLLQIVCGLVQSNLVKAYRYTRDGVESSYIDNTIIYKTTKYKEQLAVLEEAHEQMHIPYLLCKVKDSHLYEINGMSNTMKHLLRNSDFVGLNDDGNYYVAFIQTTIDNFDIISKRFSDRGIKLEVSKC